jgi:hypothetical protein
MELWSNGKPLRNTPALEHSIIPIEMRLTAWRAVSCYGVSGWPNRAAGKGPAKGSARTDERASFGLESAANK